MDDKDKRIAELEARLKRMLCLQAAAETKLTMVQAEIGNQRALDADGDGVDLHAIERHLYDTPAPLAVVEGRRTWFDDNGSREAIEIDDLILWNQLPETFMLVIMSKPKEAR